MYLLSGISVPPGDECRPPVRKSIVPLCPNGMDAENYGKHKTTIDIDRIEIKRAPVLLLSVISAPPGAERRPLLQKSVVSVCPGGRDAETSRKTQTKIDN